MLRYISRNRSKGDEIRVQSTPFFAVSLLYVKISPYPDRGEDELIGPTPSHRITVESSSVNIEFYLQSPRLRDQSAFITGGGGKGVSGGTEEGSDVANRV